MSLIKATLTAAALLGSTAAMANAIVVRATGPSAPAYPTGKSLPADGKIALKPGDAVTVLDAKGTRVLKGPGMVAVSGTGAVSGSGFAMLISNTGARQSRTGATRSAIGGGPARSPNVWYIDASKGGLTCVLDANTASLWRPSDAEAGSLTVTSSTGKNATIDYRVGQSVRAWPVADVPLTDGGQYKISGAGMKVPVSVKVALLAQAPEGLDGTASALIGKGCSSQLGLIAEASMETPAFAAVD